MSDDEVPIAEQIAAVRDSITWHLPRTESEAHARLVRLRAALATLEEHERMVAERDAARADLAEAKRVEAERLDALAIEIEALLDALAIEIEALRN